ncbi:MAG: threonylcarbamoyl-AMP synthase [Peptococcaceae bacterium]|nr:threonylcarbamoyl-AMP synthase [Peptococcaceae bacterium]
MKTFYWRVDAFQPDDRIMDRAGFIIRQGGLVAFPTETVYGLGADALNAAAVERIFTAKGRPADNPLIVHVRSIEQVYSLVAALPDRALKLARAFWPGPLTMVLPRSREVPDAVTAGLDTVAVRMPAHRVALALINAAGTPIAAPSANASGRPSPTTAEHVRQDLDGRIEAVIDAGPAPVGVESTVLDLTTAVPVILRPGGVTRRRLMELIGNVAVHPEKTEGPPRSPGMKYRHYAPGAPVILVEGASAALVRNKMRELAAGFAGRGMKVVILASSESAGYFRDYRCVTYGRHAEPATVAAGLYDALRRCDELAPDVIVAEGVEPGGMGTAVADRLRRAASEIIKVTR